MNRHPLRRQKPPFRWWAFLGCVLGLGSAPLLFLWIAPELSEGLRSYRWPAQQGTLLEAERSWANMGRSYEESHQESWVQLWYAYTGPDGAPHSGQRFDVSTAPGAGRRHLHSLIDLGMAQHALARAPRVEVYVDPQMPEQAVLRRGIAYSTTGWLCLVALLFGAGLICLRCLDAPPGRLAEFEVEGPEGKPQKRAGPLMTLVLWLTVFPMGWAALAIGLAGLGQSLFADAPPSWPLLGYLFVACTILVWPAFARISPVQLLMTLLIVGAPLLGVYGLAVQAWHAETLVIYTIPEAETLARLQDAHPAIREAATWQVFRAQGPPEARPLVEALLEDANPAVREAASAAAKRLRMRFPD